VYCIIWHGIELQIVPNGPAANIGLRVGDRILTVSSLHMLPSHMYTNSLLVFSVISLLFYLYFHFIILCCFYRWLRKEHSRWRWFEVLVAINL